MNIAYSTDENYVRHVYVSLFSLLEKNIAEKEISVYVIDNKISQESKEALKSLVESFNRSDNERKIEFIDFSKYEPLLKNAAPWGSLSTYGRLFLPEISDIDRILYIDCDTAVCDSLSDLYNISLDGYALAGVQDNAGPASRIGVGLNSDERYINAGIALINLDYWREYNATEKCLEFIKSYNGNVPCADQGTLNGVFNGKIFILPPKYNVMTPIYDFSADRAAKFFEISNYYNNSEFDEARQHPVIVHYTGGFHIRPWYINSNHPMKDYYRHYMSQSPWKESYLPETTLGKRTEAMYFAYRFLPFNLFLMIHRVVRKAKRIINHEK